MQVKTITVAVASLIGLITASGGGEPYDYAKHGADWGEIKGYEDCSKPGGGPIDLKTELSQYKKHSADSDELVANFQNLRNTQVKWTGDTIKTSLPPKVNQFQSEIGQIVFGAERKEWEGLQFHFHAGSEHTVNGVRQDLEMHTVFKEVINKEAPDKKFVAAAVGILFSVNDFNVKLSRSEQLVIDTFFETLDWAKKDDPIVNFITYGNLMNMVDLKNRWIYQGSVTTPPCAQKVYFNVLQTIYPIKKKHVDLFKAQLARSEPDGELAALGNWREIQKITDQEPAIVTETSFGTEKDSANSINYDINVDMYNQNIKEKCPPS